jgi:predicted nuclease with TOPRIM domain
VLLLFPFSFSLSAFSLAFSFFLPVVLLLMDLSSSEITFVQQSLALGDEIEVVRHRKGEPYVASTGTVGRRIDTATVRVQWHENGDGFFPHPDVLYKTVVVKRGPHTRTFVIGCLDEYNRGRQNGHVIPGTDSDDSVPRQREPTRGKAAPKQQSNSNAELWSMMQGLAAEIRSVSGLKPEIEQKFEEFYEKMQRQQTMTQALAEDLDEDMSHMQQQIEFLSNERARMPTQLEQQIASTHDELARLRQRVSAERTQLQHQQQEIDDLRQRDEVILQLRAEVQRLRNVQPEGSSDNRLYDIVVQLQNEVKELRRQPSHVAALEANLTMLRHEVQQLQHQNPIHRTVMDARSTRSPAPRAFVEQLRAASAPAYEEISDVSTRDGDTESIATDPDDIESIRHSVDRATKCELKIPHDKIHLTLFMFGRLTVDEFNSRWRERFRHFASTERQQHEVERLLSNFSSSVTLMKSAVAAKDCTQIYSASRIHGQQMQEALRLELRAKGAAGFVIDSVERLYDKAVQSKRHRAFSYDDLLDKAARTTQPRYGHSGNQQGQGQGFRGRGGPRNFRGRGTPQLTFHQNYQHPEYNPQPFRGRGQ